MKTFVLVGLLCLLGMVMSYPYPQQNQANSEGRVLRRRNQENPSVQSRSRPSKPTQSEFVPPVRPKKQSSRYSPEESQPSSLQERYASPSSKRRAPVEARDKFKEVDYEASASGGSYDESAAKFEQGVQNNADSYNSDQGVKDGRVQFSIAGQQGPNSYRFGYDTGKGADRTFRIEERDAAGVIHGRYGYYDPSGKFRIVNYSAHPEHGFQAEGNFASN